MHKLFPLSRGSAGISTFILLIRTNLTHRNFMEKKPSISYKWKVLIQACAFFSGSPLLTFQKWQASVMLKAFRLSLGNSTLCAGADRQVFAYRLLGATKQTCSQSADLGQLW